MAKFESNIRRISCAAATAALVLCPEISRADESGISFWLPGLYGSLSATPAMPGWSVATIYYHTSVDASGAAAASREFQVGRFSPNVNINLNVALSGQADLQFIAPTYTFAEPVLGGQFASNSASVLRNNRNATIFAPFAYVATGQVRRRAEATKCNRTGGDPAQEYAISAGQCSLPRQASWTEADVSVSQ